MASDDPGGRLTTGSTVGNISLVAQREYVERVRSRLFVASTLLLAGLAIIVALIPLAIRVVDRGTVTRVAVVAQESGLADRSVSIMDSVLNGGLAGPAGERRAYLLEPADDLEAAEAAVREGRLGGVLVVVREANGRLAFELRSGETLGPDRAQLMAVGSFAVAILDWTAAQPSGGTPFEIPQFTPRTIGGPSNDGEPISGAEFANRRILGITFVVLCFITLVIYGMWVAAGVVAEKSSRVMELLISAATAPQLVLGKIAGIGLAGLTQVGFVLGPALLALLLSERLGDALLGERSAFGSSLAGLSPGLLLAFLAYFVLGFALYAAIYAAAGSLVSKPEDLQVIALPLSLIAIVGYLQAIMALSGGIAGFVRVASFVPLWSPFVMMSRLSVGHVEPWELVLSLALLLVTVPLVTLLAIRVYRAGVLLYGQRPGWRLFMRAIREGG
jgi:ABC-2 type transport system permease protein